jgi:urease accessory protein
MDHVVCVGIRVHPCPRPFRTGRGYRFLGRFHPSEFWLLPVVFPLVMALAGAYGVLGLPLHGVETGIALSAIMLGAMVAGAVRPPLWVAALLVGAFAIFHGYAHGVELPVGADAIAFSMGFVIATGMLHLSGIAFGGLSHWPAGRIAVRVVGAVIAVIGLGYLVGVV